MKKTITAFTLAAVMASTNCFASGTEAETEPGYQPTRMDAGLGIGALAGAIVGGPIGFVVGGFIGAQTGQVEDYKQQLQEKDQQLARLHRDISVTHADMAEARAALSESQAQRLHKTSSADQRLASTLAGGLRVDVLFRTNSQNIEPHYTSQLQRVIAVMKLFPEMDIQIAGHADPRGAASDNLALSKRRVNSIRQVLIQAGIDNKRIHTTAWGERHTISTASDIEAYAFDRRVVINFDSKTAMGNTAASRQDKRNGNVMPASLHQP